MDATSADGYRLQMEALLLSDPAIRQAKIINLNPSSASPDKLSPANPSETSWTAALALSFTAKETDAAIVGRARKTLRKKMNEVGQKSLVPKNWIVLASLPILYSSANLLSPLDSSIEQTLQIIDEDALLSQLRANMPVASDGSVVDKIKQVVTLTLKLEPSEVDMDKTFANLGGDSITAIEVMARCMEKGVAFHVVDLLQAESLNKLAESVQNQEGPTPSA